MTAIGSGTGVAQALGALEAADEHAMPTDPDGLHADCAARVPAFGPPPRRAAATYLLPLNLLDGHPLDFLVLDFQRSQATSQCLAMDDSSDVVWAG